MDQDKALAFVRAKAELCRECATREADWKADRFAFVANTKRCVGCELIEIEQGQLPENAKGMKVFLEPRAVAEARDAEEEAMSDGVS
jgi:hypothetical protein